MCRAYHELLSHAGRDKTLKVIQRNFFHPCMAKMVAQVVKYCATCRLHKGNTEKSFPVHRRQPAGPYHTYAVDLMELPRSKRGYKCLLVGIDLYTKFGHAVPLRNKTSATVAQALEGSILATLPKTPTIMLTDGGAEFKGNPFQRILETYGITHRKSIPYASHTNACVERLNRTIKSRLATACHDAQHEWDRQIYVGNHEPIQPITSL